jgi:hypothetical protein
MLIHVQTFKQNQESKDEFLFRLPQTCDSNTRDSNTQDSNAKVYSISKRNLCSAVQMLQQNECTSILSNSQFSLTLRNQGANKFSVTFDTRDSSYTAECTPHCELSQQFQSSSLPSLLAYLHHQKVPNYNECVLLSGKMQNTFGFLSHNATELSIVPKRIDDTFLLDNATTISKLTDMFNSKLHNSLRERALMRNTSAEQAHGATNVFSASYAALQLKLAAIFCATALKDNSCICHVTQGMISDMSPDMQKSLYEGAEPDKHYVTLLLKGNSLEERICRINLAVRFFPPTHPFTSNKMQTAMALNASRCHTGVLVLTGVRNNVAAAIYHNSDTQTVQQNKLALAAYMGVL